MSKDEDTLDWLREIRLACSGSVYVVIPVSLQFFPFLSRAQPFLREVQPFGCGKKAFVREK